MHSVIPVYRETQYAKDRVSCSALFSGVRNTRLLGMRPNGRFGRPQVVPELDNPDLYELVGYWAGSDDTPTQKMRPEWKGLMSYTRYLRGIQRERRHAKDVERRIKRASKV